MTPEQASQQFLARYRLWLRESDDHCSWECLVGDWFKANWPVEPVEFEPGFYKYQDWAVTDPPQYLHVEPYTWENGGGGWYKVEVTRVDGS